YLEEPRFLQIDRLAPFQPRGTDVAVILDLMIHDLDLVLELVRSEVVDVRATGVPLLTTHVDIANARIEFANGAIANVTASLVSGTAGAQALALAFRVADAVQASPLATTRP